MVPVWHNKWQRNKGHVISNVILLSWGSAMTTLERHSGRSFGCGFSLTGVAVHPIASWKSIHRTANIKGGNAATVNMTLCSEVSCLIIIFPKLVCHNPNATQGVWLSANYHLIVQTTDAPPCEHLVSNVLRWWWCGETTSHLLVHSWVGKNK